MIYAVEPDGSLRWYKNEAWLPGEATWTVAEGITVSTNWNGLQQIFSAGSGVIYAIATDGNLLWHKHLGQADGSN